MKAAFPAINPELSTGRRPGSAVCALRKVSWISQALPTGLLDDKLKSPFASVRYRLLIPARELQNRGIENVVISPEADARRNEELLAGSSAAVFGKLSIFDPRAFRESARQHIALAARAQSLGIKVIADICEDRFDHELLGGYWRDMVRMADKVVTSTVYLAELVREAGAQEVEIIPDPVEGQGGDPRFDADLVTEAGADKPDGRARRLRILWFGHQSNLDEVEEFLPALDRWAAARSIYVDFDIVTAAGFGVEKLVEERMVAGSGARVRYVEWSLEAADGALRNCDFVIIPATLHISRKKSKSANRLTESLHAGRFVLAHPVPSYLEFAKYAWISDDLLEGMEWALANPHSVVDRIKAGQQLIRSNYLPGEIALRWANAVAQATAIT